MRLSLYSLSLFTLLLLSCTERDGYRLTAQPAERTGVDFINLIVENDTTNIIRNEYLYNGGGVGIGDFDGNGLPDLFFGGNLVSSRLYLQTAPWQFEDVTEASGLTTGVWIAGVNVHDFDGNGYEDLYLATLNPTGKMDTPNLLFLNQGVGTDSLPTFREVAAEYGLDNRSYSTHSACFDLEGDGDLDLYVLNNSIEEMSRKTLRGTDTSGRGRSVDVLYRNLTVETGRLAFERTNELRTEGWGLGIVPQDFNGDGLTDLYLANDFISEDGYLLSDGRGGFDWHTQEAFVHTSKNSMGVDAADLNNDGLPDLATADMLPDDNLRQKTMFSDINFQVDATAYARGYGRQYVRNVLQLNTGDGTYSDLAFLAGMAATDWSWTPLLADFDNNGHRDVFISNGYPRDVTNRDFVDFAQNSVMFGETEAVYQNTMAALYELDGVHQPNYLFANQGNLNFRPTDWLPPTPTYSNGAVYLDLDRDGDLDLVTNNLNEPAGLYRNYSREWQPDSTHFLQVELRGPAGNPDALGAKVYLTYGDGQHAYGEQQRQRGYLGTVDALLHFGLGTAETVDSLFVVWPNDRTSELASIMVDQRIVLDIAEATAPATPPTLPSWARPPSPTLSPLPADGPTYRESAYTDFDYAPLAVRDRSHDGPALASADLDGDGREELIVGGAAGQPVQVYAILDSLTLQQSLDATDAPEITALIPLDYDGDGDLDLYAGTGSSEFRDRAEMYRDMLFENDGTGNLRPTDLLPELPTVTSSVAAADLDGDGGTDLFVGSRQRIGSYPRPAASYVLINENGRYRKGQEFEAGLVTDAVWTDLNGDDRPDLITVGEYAPPRVYLNDGGKLVAQPADDDLAGWWYSLSPADIDGDGDTDLLAGNLGGNSYYQASPDRPLRLRVDDYDNNGTLDPILMMFIGEQSHPVHPRNTLGRQLPGFKKTATTYAMYGEWAEGNMPQLGPEGFVMEARELRSAVFINDGNGRFTPRFLPPIGQTAPIRDALPVELPDGRTGWLAVQNDYAVEVLGGRLDAGTGLLISWQDGAPHVDPDYWTVRDDARSVVRLNDLIVVGMNDGPLRLFRKPQPLTR